jgi:2'-5' RNA ligase
MSHHNELRVFIAIPLPSPVVNYLAELLSLFQNQIPEKSIKWVRPENIHLTLKFLGNISKSNLDILVENLNAFNQFAPFQMEINKLGAFPSIFKPQVVWVGGTSTNSLIELNNFVEQTTSFLEIQNDKKPFSPHLTIARIRPGIKQESFENLKQILVKNRQIDPIIFSINQYCVYQSNLTPKGPAYTVVQKYELPSR